LKETETSTVIAVNAVGAIKNKLADASLVFPDQIIDYTYGREHTFFGSDQRQVTHVDFSEPYCEKLRIILIEAARRAAIPAAETGTYGATQGPRFESAAEIRRLERDGADIVGMTGMPEAGLARELGLCYACIAVVANPAAGKAEGGISLKAGLARELGLCYACIAVVANPAAGKAEGGISLKAVEKNLQAGMIKVRKLLEEAIPMIASE
jgi:purine nucleoside phosphorylase